MVYSYYPGCTLKNKAQQLDIWARQSAEILGVTMQELPFWQCCGGTYTAARDEIATKLASVRALAAARDSGQDLLTLCSACHNVLKRVNIEMTNNENTQNTVNRYLQSEKPYHGETRVIHYLEMLRDVVGFENLAKKVVHPLTGRKIAAYYGCLLLRPSAAMKMDDPENPVILENFIRAIGATPVIYADRNECCGGYITLEDRTIAEKRSGRIVTSAADMGADTIITACPLCRYNLVKNGGGNLPVVYFTELLAEALGVKSDAPKEEK